MLLFDLVEKMHGEGKIELYLAQTDFLNFVDDLPAARGPPIIPGCGERVHDNDGWPSFWITFGGNPSFSGGGADLASRSGDAA